jgi:predicted permease
MRWGWAVVFAAEVVLFVVVVCAFAVGLVGRVRRLRDEVARLRGAVPASQVPTQLARLSAARGHR